MPETKNEKISEQNKINNKIVCEKKTKSKLTFTYYNANNPEKTKEIIKNIIVSTLINKKINIILSDIQN